MKWNMGIGFSPLMKKSSGSWSSYWTSHSDFWGRGRSALTIPDDYGNDATIMPAYVNVTASNYILGIIPDFAETDLSGFVEAKVLKDSNQFIVFASDNIGTSTHYVRMGILNTGKPYLTLRSATTFTNTAIADSAISNGWHTIKWASTGTEYQISVDGVPIAFTMTSGSNDGKWFQAVHTYRTNVGIGASYGGASSYSVSGLVSWVNYSDKNKWYLHGNGKYEFDCIGNLDLYWVGTPSPIYGSEGSTFMLDNGYSLWAKEGEPNEYMPYSAINTPRASAPNLEAMGTYSNVANINGNASFHNGAPSLIDFTLSGLDNFDRSNTTIFSAAARAGADYDAANPLRWRIQDISNPNSYYTWKNTGHQWRQFSKVDSEDEIILLLREIISGTQEPSAAGIEWIINYCGIEDFFA